MPDTPSITINYDFPYRGKQETFSNTYHFSGPTPGNPAEWKEFADAIWASTHPFFSTAVKYRGHYGYQAGNEHAVDIRDYIAEGIVPQGGRLNAATVTAPGDVAVWVRWATPDRNARGKIIYLRKYFHGVETNGDLVGGQALPELKLYAAKMTDGTLPGGRKICGPQGAVAGAWKVAPNASFRQLKRTGKRPSR